MSDETFKFSCRFCGQRIAVTRAAIGTSGACPTCKNDLIVPKPVDDRRHAWRQTALVVVSSATAAILFAGAGVYLYQRSYKRPDAGFHAEAVAEPLSKAATPAPHNETPAATVARGQDDPKATHTPRPSSSQSALDAAAIPAPDLSTAVTAALAKEDIGPFILKYIPSYRLENSQHLIDDLWNASSGAVKTTIRNAKGNIYIALSKTSASPSAVGMAFPMNKSGWISIPPEVIARFIKPDKPGPAPVQAGLNRFYRNLSSKLYATGNGRALLQFGNGNGMSIDIKEDPQFPESLVFKTTFLRSGSYQVSEFDPELYVDLQEDIPLQTVSHGKVRSDGWSTFETPRSLE